MMMTLRIFHRLNVVVLFVLCTFIVTSTTTTSVVAFQGLSILPKWNFDNIFVNNNKNQLRTLDIQNDLIDTIRKQQQSQQEQQTNDINYEIKIKTLIEQLEKTSNNGNIINPAISKEIYGRWRLIYSTKTDTSSPIQRTAFSKVNSIPIYQDIIVDNNQLKVNQVIQFTESFYLSVDALASTSAYPLAELTERKTTGKVFGMNLLGVSLVTDDEIKEFIGIDEMKPNTRIDFVFDEGNFYSTDNNNKEYKIPYPVPFRLPILRDWVKGWIIITYLSSNLRIVRGNKGTTFVLMKE